MHRIALIGFGLAGKAFHAPLIAATPGLELASVVTSRAAEVAADYPGARVLPSLDAALADRSIDLVVLATPDHLHTAQALAALDAGKHVVIDKPLAPAREEARAIALHAAQRGRMLSVFHNRRWDADFLTLRRLIDEGALGVISAFESRFDRFRPEPGTRWKDSRAGGVWQDIGPHLVDQALVLFGRPQAVSADLAVLRPGGQSVDHAEVLLRYPGCRVSLHISMVLPDHGLRMAVHGRKASFVKHGLDAQEDQSKAGMRPDHADWGFDPVPGRLTLADGTVRAVVPERGDYPAFYRAVAAALAGEGPMPVSTDDALAVMDVIAAATASSNARREIAL
ncbi:MAG: oxidoreductase [Novosphingobium sp.]|nr:oxidoreductase [Novosphingobium sp.]